MLNASFDELKKITDEVYSGGRATWARDAIDILFRNGYKLRQDDGHLVEVNFSIPTSRKDVFVLGLRHTKRDRTFTEDHFLFEKGKSITYFSGRKLEIFLKEYAGTHKKQISI